MNIECLNLLKYHKKGTKVESRKTEGMNQFRLQYLYTWKCHNETFTLYIYLKQIKMLLVFTKPGKRKAKQVLSGGLIPVGGTG
jgi:hypothetical protein